MTKRWFAAFITGMLAVFAAIPTPAPARWANPDTSGYCSSGTCSRSGGMRAGNVKFCKVEYCREYTAVSAKTIAAAPRAPCQTTGAMTLSWSWSPWPWFWLRRDC